MVSCKQGLITCTLSSDNGQEIGRQREREREVEEKLFAHSVIPSAIFVSGALEEVYDLLAVRDRIHQGRIKDLPDGQARGKIKADLGSKRILRGHVTGHAYK